MGLLDHLRDPDAPGAGPGEEPLASGTMSFLEHLEELRRCIFRAMIGVLLAFFVCFAEADRIYGFMSRPLVAILKAHHLNQNLVYFNPIDPFNLYVKLGLICALFLSSPWVLYQVWAFIRPGLYARERRWVIPFVLFTSMLFVLGGVFAYKFAFPIALNFLIGYAHRFTPQININEYFNLFATVVLGLGLVFELPTLIFFLSLLGIVNARFLLRNFRYAVLVIFILAAIVTPTSDVTTMMVFAAPMVGLYVLGIGIAYIFGKDRRDRRRRRSASA
jgi:sec-independent protein translocase protein TatC